MKLPATYCWLNAKLCKFRIFTVIYAGWLYGRAPPVSKPRKQAQQWQCAHSNPVPSQVSALFLAPSPPSYSIREPRSEVEGEMVDR